MATGDKTQLGTPLKGVVTAIALKKDSNQYLVTGRGEVFSQHKSTGALTKTATIPREKLTAICSNETLNYIGAASGKIYIQTIAGGAISATLAGQIKGAGIAALAYDATQTLIYVLDDKGQVWTIDE